MEPAPAPQGKGDGKDGKGGGKGGGGKGGGKRGGKARFEHRPRVVPRTVVPHSSRGLRVTPRLVQCLGSSGEPFSGLRVGPDRLASVRNSLPIRFGLMSFSRLCVHVVRGRAVSRTVVTDSSRGLRVTPLLVQFLGSSGEPFSGLALRTR